MKLEQTPIRVSSQENDITLRSMKRLLCRFDLFVLLHKYRWYHSAISPSNIMANRFLMRYAAKNLIFHNWAIPTSLDAAPWLDSHHPFAACPMCSIHCPKSKTFLILGVSERIRNDSWVSSDSRAHPCSMSDEWSHVSISFGSGTLQNFHRLSVTDIVSQASDEVSPGHHSGSSYR
jgi:hypothetical protein